MGTPLNRKRTRGSWPRAGIRRTASFKGSVHLAAKRLEMIIVITGTGTGTGAGTGAGTGRYRYRSVPVPVPLLRVPLRVRFRWYVDG